MRLADAVTTLWYPGPSILPDPDCPMKHQRNIPIIDLFMMATAIVATMVAQAGWQTGFALLKGLPMLAGIALIWRAQGMEAGLRRWLLAGAVGGLAGDLLLLVPGLFLAGLAAFLVGHLCYLAGFIREAGPFPHRKSLAAMLAFALAALAVILPSLPAAMLAPVILYALTICLMAAQAVGRHLARPGEGSIMVAAGALLFVLSDLSLAVNRFVTPLPLSSLLVLGTYYPAQYLILRGMAKWPPGT